MSVATTNKNGRVPRIDEFDGLRAVAVLLVFLYHFDEDFFYFGWCGVDIFFAISGFVITLQCYSLREQMSGKDCIKEFYIRRIGRIFPLYYFLLVGLLFVPIALGTVEIGKQLLTQLADDVSSPSVWKNAVFLTNFFIYFEGFSSVSYGITWSLAVEEHFYLVFPFLFFFLESKHLRKILVTAVITVFLFRLLLAFNTDRPGRLYYLTFTRIDAILLGCIAAGYFFSNTVSKKLWILAVATVILGIMFLYICKYNDISQIIIGYTLVPAAIALSMLMISHYNHPILTFLLANKPMTFLGSVSYGFYLIHIWIVNAAEGLHLKDKLAMSLNSTIGNTLLFCGEFVIILLLSAASFYCFEKPTRRYVTRQLRRLVPPI